IELGEIEAALHKRVKEAAVIVHGEGSDKQLVGYYVGDATPQALRDAIRQQLPEYMVPGLLMPLAALPLTPNGKVDRRQLMALPLVDDRVAADSAPRTDLEKRVAAAWCKVLKIERVGVRTSFFDLGGHSLLLVSLHRELETSLAIKIALVTLFEHTTVERQATYFAGVGSANQKSDEWLGPAQDARSERIQNARRRRRDKVER
ncbi:MAG: non-ribosomal peptide synthetase, partial [Deltaproteobacteria bacterium]|nr:non-ribosomal peptide synthetase [Deltaproteobacteria bacterium]